MLTPTEVHIVIKVGVFVISCCLSCYPSLCTHSPDCLHYLLSVICLAIPIFVPNPQYVPKYFHIAFAIEIVCGIEIHIFVLTVTAFVITFMSRDQIVYDQLELCRKKEKKDMVFSFHLPIFCFAIFVAEIG